MKQKLLFLGMFLSVGFSMNAQLLDGEVVADWTMDDIDGNTHSIATHLDAGRSVFIDLSATWCGPCWEFHEAGTLEDLYVNNGPIGAPGVTGTNDNVMVFYFESDEDTPTSELSGGGSSQGDWITGTNFPMIDGQEPADYFSEVRATGYPTIIKVCPDRTVEMFNPFKSDGNGGFDPMDESDLLAKICSPVPAPKTNDAKLIVNYTPEVDFCEGESHVAQVKMQNYGSADLTSATIKAFDGSTELGSTNWSGSLSSYAAEVISINLTNISGDYNITKFEITTADDDISNNTFNTSLSIKQGLVSGTNVKLQVTTDGYGSEFGYWLRDLPASDIITDVYSGWFSGWGNGAISDMLNYQGQNYGSENSLGNEEEWEIAFELSAGCHTLALYDSYGDGLTDPSNGYIGLKGVDADNNDIIIYENTGTAYSEEYIVFTVDGDNTTELVSVEENTVSDFNIYPNPTNGVANVEFNVASSNNVTVDVINTLGQVVLNNNLGTVSGAQKVNINGNNLESGIYFVNIKIGDKTTTQKLTVSK